MATPFRHGQALGFFCTPYSSIGQALSTANVRVGYSLIPNGSRTINNARVYMSAVTGSLASTDITAELWNSSGSNGSPGASIETGKLPSATITAAGWYNFTGFSTALTPGQQYWIVLKNANASPGTNNCTCRITQFFPQSSLLQFGQADRFVWSASTSGNAGASWGSRYSPAGSIRVGYSDSSYDGICSSAFTVPTASNGVYSTREVGIKFTSPANVTLNVIGIAAYFYAETGTPTGSPRFGLWTGASPTLSAYTDSIPAAADLNFQWAYSYFSSVQTIPAGTVCRITLGETTQSDTSSHFYGLYETALDTDANSTPLLPFNGTATKTYFNGTSWADATLGEGLYGMAVLLDTAGEFASASTPSIDRSYLVQSIGTY